MMTCMISMPLIDHPEHSLRTFSANFAPLRLRVRSSSLRTLRLCVKSPGGFLCTME